MFEQVLCFGSACTRSAMGHLFAIFFSYFFIVTGINIFRDIGTRQIFLKYYKQYLPCQNFARVSVYTDTERTQIL